MRQSLPVGAAMRDEIMAVFRTALDSTLSRLNLVTREDFDAQAALLARTRERLEALEAAVAEMERGDRPPDTVP